MLRRGLLAALSLSLWCASAGAQDADPDREHRARLHYESATAHFDTGDYESALSEFRAAYAESPHAELLYNIFLCEERLGNLRSAVDALEAFLATPDVPRRAILERRLAHLRERASRGETRIEASEVEGARPMQVDAPEEPGAAVEPSPAVEPSAEAGATVEPSAPAAAASEPPVLAITGFTIAAAGLVTFAIAGGITLAEDARLGACRPECEPEQVEAITVSAITADVGLGVALAGAVLGVIGLLVAPSTPAERAALRPRGLGLEGSF